MSNNGNRIDFDNLFNGGSSYQGNYNSYGSRPPQGRQSSLPILSLIFSIASIWFCTYPFLGIGFGVAALVMRNVFQKTNPKNKMTKAAFVIAIIGIVLTALIFIVCIIVLATNPELLNKLLASYGFA